MQLTIYSAINISSLTTKNFWFRCHNHNFISLHWGFTHTLHVCSFIKPYWNIFTSEALNIRKEVNPSFCFALLILSLWKSSKRPIGLKSPYNALQTLDHWLRHLCLWVLHSRPSYTSIWQPENLHLVTILYHLLYLLTTFLINCPLKQVFRAHFGPKVKFSGWNTVYTLYTGLIYIMIFFLSVWKFAFYSLNTNILSVSYCLFQS